MNDCCEIRAVVPERQRRVLQTVLAVNVAMFVTEVGAGLLAHSTALLADSVDMLGDAIVYGFSLYVVARGLRWQARAALLKGGIMAGFGIAVVVEAIAKMVRGAIPEGDVMAAVGLVALAANTFCLWSLSRHRSDDVNMQSAWVCSRNDVVANSAVLLAAGVVLITRSPWPDIAVGLMIAALFGSSAITVVRRAILELRSPVSPQPVGFCRTSAVHSAVTAVDRSQAR